MTLSVAIHELDDLTTPVETLTATYTRAVNPIINDAGMCSFVILRNNPDIDEVQFGRVAIITDSVSSQRFAFIIEHQTRVVHHVDGEAHEAYKVSGRLLAALLERVPVYSENGVDQAQSDDTRYFNFANPAYDDTGWDAAVLTTNTYVPEGWLDPTGAIGPYIFGQTADIDSAPAGATWLRREFTVGSEVGATIYASADNWGVLYLDGVEIMEIGAYQSDAYLRSFETDVNLSAGTHVLGARVFNKGSDNHGGLRLAAVESADPSTVIVQSDTSWVSQEGGVPGMTPGAVMDVLLTEAQTNGYLDGWSWTFDGEYDSAFELWPTEREIAVQVGDDLLTVLRQWVSSIADFEVLLVQKSLYLNLPGTLGAGSAVGVEFTAGVSVSALEVEGEG